MSSLYNFKKIACVPLAKDFIDFTLSKTQRKTPNEIHKHFKISRIRNFYLKKIKFTQQNFHDRLAMILDEFPKLDDIHPFYADLINVLYDRDHYKLALGQISTARNLIDNVGRDYARLLKYGDTLYRCKQLKKAALGRMVSIIKRQTSSLEYLEQVRQHLSRLPCIDPNTRTLLVCGFPNVGKSSFINKLTRVDAEVQPYAFTTKSLYVGHTDYKYLRWQVIDTPGILDHPLEERNTIEMQAITALAHLKAIVMFVLDLSELCNYSIEQQLALFENIKPLFVNKPLMVLYNKCDVIRLAQLPKEKLDLINKFQQENACLFAEMSTLTDEGVMEARNKACDALLAHRIEAKLNSKKSGDILARLHVARPQPRDNKERPPFIPSAVFTRADRMDSERKLLRHLQEEDGPDFQLDLRAEWKAVKPEERYDPIPEMFHGRNIADYIDPDIQQKLMQLERDEALRSVAGFYERPEAEDDLTVKTREDAGLIRVEVRKKIQAHTSRKSKRKIYMPHGVRKRSLSEARKELFEKGYDDGVLVKRARSKVDYSVMFKEPRFRTLSKANSKPPRDVSGVRDVKMMHVVRAMAKRSQRTRNLRAMKGEGDHHIPTLRPKHLFVGKRTLGTANHR
jgi:nucleolar GTP-binding protein